MTTTPKDGGPAFPASRFETVEIRPEVTKRVPIEYPGMSIRDYFAGQAIVGALSNEAFTKHAHGNYRGSEPRYFANIAYDIADAMLEAREADE